MNLYPANKKRGSVIRSNTAMGKYGTKRYDNPFFQKKRAALSLPVVGYDLAFRIRFYAGVFLLALIIGGAYFLYSDHFKIKNINISGGGMIDTKKIQDIAWEQANSSMLVFLPQRNLFLFNKSKLLARLNEKYSFEKINIDKKGPDTININYIEKSYAFIWQENDKYFYAAVNRDVISEANVLDIKQKDYPLINNLSDKKVSDNVIQVDQKYLDYVILLWNKFKEVPQKDYKIDRFIIDNDINTVKIALLNGPQIYFNTEGDLDKQINKLNIIKTDQLKDDFNKKQYIDLRIGDSVYYR